MINRGLRERYQQRIQRPTTRGRQSKAMTNRREKYAPEIYTWATSPTHPEQHRSNPGAAPRRPNSRTVAPRQRRTRRSPNRRQTQCRPSSPERHRAVRRRPSAEGNHHSEQDKGRQRPGRVLLHHPPFGVPDRSTQGEHRQGRSKAGLAGLAMGQA